MDRGTSPLTAGWVKTGAGGLPRRHCGAIDPSGQAGALLRTKLAIFGILFPLIIVLDVITKQWALDVLSSGRRQILGGLVPLTLAFNKGAAFGLSLGEDSRWFFVPVTIIALGLLWVLFKQAHEGDYLRVVSLSLVVSGAVGNLWDRLRWSRGVVDFIGPIDLGFAHFPIFNVADMSISCGAVALAVSFWQEERRERKAPTLEAPARSDPEPDSPGQLS
jgi:signal peptidase II